MSPLVRFVLCLVLVRGSFQTIKGTLGVVKDNLDSTTFEPGSMSAEAEVFPGGNAKPPSFKKQRDAISRDFRLATDPMGQCWKESHRRLGQLSAKVAKYLEEMKGGHVHIRSEIQQGLSNVPTNSEKCDVMYKSLLEDYPWILNREGMEVELRKGVQTQHQRPIGIHEKNRTSAKNPMFQRGSNEVEQRYMAQEAAKWKISGMHQGTESEICSASSRCEDKIVEHHQQSNSDEYHYISRIQDLLQKAINHGGYLGRNIDDAYIWRADRSKKQNREKIHSILEKLDNSEIMNHRIEELTEISIPGIRGENSSSYAQESLENSIQFFNQENIHDSFRIRVRFPSISISRVEKTAHKMSQEFRNLRAEIRITQELINYLKWSELSGGYDEASFDVVEELQDELFEASIKHLMYEMHREIGRIDDHVPKEKELDVEVPGKNIDRLGHLELASTGKELLHGLVTILQKHNGKITNDAIFGRKIPEYLTELEDDELQSSFTISIEKAIFRQIAYLYKFKMVEVPDLEEEIKDSHTAELIGKHLHNSYQNLYSEDFLPDLEHLLNNEDDFYLKELLDDSSLFNKQVILYQIIDCNYKALRRTSEKLGLQFNHQFDTIYWKFTRGRFFNSLSRSNSLNQNKKIDEVEIFLEKSLNYLEDVPNSFKKTGYFDLVEIHAQPKMKITPLFDEVQYLLNFYTLKFFIRFFKHDFDKEIQKSQHKNLTERMRSIDSVISERNMQRIFFSERYGFCNFPSFYENLSLEYKRTEDNLVSKLKGYFCFSDLKN